MISGLQQFEFEIVAIDRQGEIVERSIRRAQQIAEDLGNGVILEMVAIQGGMFRMGSRESQGYADEHPQHSVRVAAFLMAKYPITQEQWAAVMDWTPPYRCRGAKRPVDRVSWHDSWEFCQRLAVKTGRAYRLPSEAEWEYACRADTTTPFYVGETLTTDLANYVGEHTYLGEPKGVYRHGTTESGSFPPNAFGLYDMHGNVWEWCADAWHDDYDGAPADGRAWESRDTVHRVLRGGCWHDPPSLCRSAARLKQAPDQGEDFFGFRVALRSLETSADVAVEPRRTSSIRRILHQIRYYSRVIPANAGIHAARADYRPVREQRAASVDMKRKRRWFPLPKGMGMTAFAGMRVSSYSNAKMGALLTLGWTSATLRINTLSSAAYPAIIVAGPTPPLPTPNGALPMSSYNEAVAKRLAKVYTYASSEEGRELADLRLIIFSDLHKGQRDTADDFQQCEKAYLAALEHYWQQGFELLLLGDVEELWECWPEPIIKAYRLVLQSEQRFADAATPSRYARFVGNHDDPWYDPVQVEKHLGPYLGGHKVIEGLRLLVHNQGQPLGELFLVHGHQGTSDSDRFGWFSKRVVRYVWRPFQRVFNIKSSSPSNNFELRQEHELAMYKYAASQAGMVLIAGHTHHPVWEGLGFEQAVQEMQARGVRPQVSEEWMEEQAAGAVTLPGKKPSYFNTGCCSFSDRSVTGIEIAGGEIRLVRWEVFAQPVRTMLFSSSLRDVFAAVV